MEELGKFKILKFGLIILIFLLISYSIILYYYNLRNSKMNSLSDLSHLLRIDLTDDIYELYDIEYDYIDGGTDINIYYSIVNTTLNNEEYYQFSDGYNPLPSSTNKLLDYSLEEFMKKNDICSSEISYMNTFFSEYETVNLFGKLSSSFEVNIYVLKSQINDDNFKIILSASIPYNLKINVGIHDLFYGCIDYNDELIIS